MPFLYAIYKLWVLTVFTVFLLLVYPFVFLSFKREGPYTTVYKLLRFSSRIVLYLSGIFPRIIRLSPDPAPPFIIAPNHTSYLDILCIYIAFKNYTIFTAKKELLHIPVFNIFFKKMNIPVERENIIASAQATEKVQDEIKKGSNVVIFPEGTIPPTAPSPGPLKRGAFFLSIKLNIPIVPVVFLYNWKRLGGHTLTDGRASPGSTIIIIEKPIYPSECNYNEQIMAEKWTHTIMKHLTPILHQPV